MIKNFEEKILDTLGLESEYFDSEHLQWVYKFKNENVLLEFIYSLDGTVSTSLYYNDILLSFCFANGLQNLYIENSEIHCDIISGTLKRKLIINPLNIMVKWEDGFL
ncbi:MULTISPECIES: hypothetical protein [Providencia]|uniref:hypothetical protein n=1 Tax=Providencia TaxID=586 RepID=UPI000F772065|nr:hypothetical protein [Providencia rettgeri]MBV2191486.1 hypothetical protein [Providencia rettgeri]